MRAGQLRDQQGLPVTSSNRPLQDWLNDWLNDWKAQSVRAGTLHSYRTRLQHVVDRIGPMRLSAVKPQDVRRVYAEMRQAGLAANTIAGTHRALKLSLSDAVKDGLLIANPCDGVVPPKPAPFEYKILLPEQVSQLVNTEPSTMWKALWGLLATTGMRIGEATALSWDAVDLEASEIHVDYTLVRKHGGGWERGQPKTRASKRLVYIGQKTVALLRAWKAEQAAEPIQSRHRFVFQGPSRDPLHHHSVSLALQKTLWRAGLPKLRVHDLRHTAATNMLAMGVPVKVVSEMLGHASTATTLDIYGHAVPAMHREAQARLDSLL